MLLHLCNAITFLTGSSPNCLRHKLSWLSHPLQSTHSLHFLLPVHLKSLSLHLCFTSGVSCPIQTSKLPLVLGHHLSSGPSKGPPASRLVTQSPCPFQASPHLSTHFPQSLNVDSLSKHTEQPTVSISLKALGPFQVWEVPLIPNHLLGMGIFCSCLVIETPEFSLLRDLSLLCGVPRAHMPQVVQKGVLTQLSQKRQCKLFIFCRMIKMILRKSLPPF